MLVRAIGIFVKRIYILGELAVFCCSIFIFINMYFDWDVSARSSQNICPCLIGEDGLASSIV